MLQVPPGLASGNLANGSMPYPVYFSNFPLRKFSFSKQLLNLKDLLRGQLFVLGVPLPLDSIRHIVSVSSPAKMGWFHATRVVTRVQNVSIPNFTTLGEDQGSPMSTHGSTRIGISKDSVTFWPPTSKPLPTASFWVRWTHVEPEPILNRCTIKTLATLRIPGTFPSLKTRPAPPVRFLTITTTIIGTRIPASFTFPAFTTEPRASSFRDSVTATVRACASHETEYSICRR